MINSIGLPNKGLEGYLSEDLPEICAMRSDARDSPDGRAHPVPLITNVMGSTVEELAALVEACDAHSEIAAIELNVSCPNVKTGLDIGADPAQLEAVVAGVRGRRHDVAVRLRGKPGLGGRGHRVHFDAVSA